MKRQLLIIGAGNVGGYLAWNAAPLRRHYDVAGFLDDDPEKVGRTLFGLPVLGTLDSVRERAGSALVVAVATPRTRLEIVQRVSRYTDCFPTIVAPKCWLSRGVRVGQGVIIYPGASVNFESTIGDFCILNMNCAVGHNCELRGFDTLAPGVNLAGFTQVDAGVEIGIGAATRQGVRLGARCVIGGQSMVLADVPPDATVVGVPARPLRTHDAAASLLARQAQPART